MTRPSRPPPLSMKGHTSSDSEPPRAASLSPGSNPSPSVADPLSPILAVAGKTDPREKIAKAFGGERKLFFPHPPPAEQPSYYRSWHYQRKINHRSMAMLRVSKPAPPGRSPSECLEFFGIEKNDATRMLFCLAENHKRIFSFRGPDDTSLIAKKWVDNVFAGSGVDQLAAGEDLDSNILVGEFLGASLQYFPVEEQDPNDQPGGFCVNNEPAFSRQMADVVNRWLLDRPVPEGHTRLLHGTARKSMVDIMNKGIDITKFQSIGDFGPGFYCADDSPSGVLTSVRFAIGSAAYDVDEDAAAVLAVERYGPSRAAIMCFDVPNEDLDHLNPTHLDGEEWEEFTALCLKEDPTESGKGCYREVFIGEHHHDAQLVVGKLVHNPRKMQKCKAPRSLPFEDKCKQYTFRNETGNVLFKDKARVAVALFDIYLPGDNDGAADRQEGDDSRDSGSEAVDQESGAEGTGDQESEAA
jgi:hypothetical protein